MHPTSSPTSLPDYRPDIDGLRAVAVAGVVVFHAFPGLLPGGFVGVDLFFVISGFLISRIVMRGLQRPGATLRGFLADFYARRVRRIFPALMLVLAVCLGLAWFVLMADDYKRLGKHTIAGTLFISNFVLRNEAGYFDTSAEDKPLLHLWSLGVEEQFYIFFPLIIAALVRWRRHGAVLPALAALFAASFVLNLGMTRSAPVSAFFYPHTRVWELLAGSLLAAFVLRGGLPAATSSSTASAVRSLSGGALIVAAFVLIAPEDRFPGWWALMPVLGATLLISAGARAPVNRLLGRRLMRGIGLISYPLYLWHWVGLSLLTMNQQDPPSVAQRLAVVAASVAAAWLTWLLIERRVQALRGPKIIVPLTGLAVMVGLTGGMISLRGGLPWRFPDVLAGIVSTDYPYKQTYRDQRCLLAFNQSGKDFAPECQAPSGTAPQLFLWGDSHAAHWYPALTALRDAKDQPLLRVAQYTAGGCPPVLGMSMPGRLQCANINDAALAHMREAQPEIVVMSANWTMYDGRPQWSTVDPARLRASVEAVRAIPSVRRIVLIGPVPTWTGSLPKVMIMTSRRHDWAPPPHRLAYGVEPASIAMDADLRAKAAEWGIEYISPRDALCNAEGCLTIVDHSLTTWDSGHLTTAGSSYVIAGQLRKLLGTFDAAPEQTALAGKS